MVRTPGPKFSSVFLGRGQSGAKFFKANFQLTTNHQEKPTL